MSTNEKIKELHTEASKIKRLAIKDGDFKLYKEASDIYRDLSNLIGKLIDEKPPNLNFVEAVQSQFVYSYECEICLYGYLYRTADYSRAIVHANEAKKIIEKWFNTTLPRLRSGNLNQSDSDKLDYYEKYWKISQLGIEAKIIEPQVNLKEQDGELISAWDLRKSMLKKQKLVYEYAEQSDLDESFIRTAKGNYYALSSNVSQGTIKILNDNLEKKKEIHDMAAQLFKYLLDAYENACQAFDANPEQEEYNNGVTILFNEIKALLNTKKVNWYDLYVDFENHQTALKIMEKTNKNKFNSIKSQRHAAERKWAILFGGIGLILLAIVAIFFPCPTNFQYVTFRILIAFAVAAAAMMISGSLSIDNQAIKASGALGVLALVYFFNPAQIAINDDCFGNESKIEGVITIKGKPGANVSIINIESEVSRQTNSLGKFEMSIPKSKYTDDKLTFRVQYLKVDTSIVITPSIVNLKKLTIGL